MEKITTEIKAEIKKLEINLAKLNSKKLGSSNEARAIRKELRDLGHYVSRNDLREGKPKKILVAKKVIVKSTSK